MNIRLIREKIRYFLFFKSKTNKIRKKLTEKNLIILASDCVGGMLMKDYGLPYYTPTVNIWYPNEDFLKLCKNPDYYFQQPLIELHDSTINSPTAKCGDITLVFGHYEGMPFSKIEKIWRKGCKSYFRAKKDGNYEFIVIANDRNGFEPFIKEFCNLPYKYKVVFTHKKYNNQFCYYMKEDSLPYVNVMTNYEYKFSFHRRYDRFDFYSWLKEIYKL